MKIDITWVGRKVDHYGKTRYWGMFKVEKLHPDYGYSIFDTYTFWGYPKGRIDVKQYFGSYTTRNSKIYEMAQTYDCFQDNKFKVRHPKLMKEIKCQLMLLKLKDA